MLLRHKKMAQKSIDLPVVSKINSERGWTFETPYMYSLCSSSGVVPGLGKLKLPTTVAHNQRTKGQRVQIKKLTHRNLIHNVSIRKLRRSKDKTKLVLIKDQPCG